MVTIAPAHGAIQAAALPASVSSAAASAVAQYYASRQDAPVWFRANAGVEASTQLVEILRRAPLDGLASGPQLAAQIETAVAAARGGDAAAVREAERLMSAAWVLYVQTIRSPTDGMLYGDASARTPMFSPEQILLRASVAPSLRDHLNMMAHVNPVYAALREVAWNDAKLSGAPSDKAVANLNRLRALPAKGRFVLVDAASARLFMYENGQPVDSMKVIVGTREMATPMIASRIHYTVLNPYWHVPDHLARSVVAKNVLKQGKAYLKTRGYEVVSDWTTTPRIIPATEIDWAGVAAGTTEIKIRQLPGNGNSMGAMKFPFPNSEGIYLHDTPNKALFAKAQRTLSNGCIRLEDAPRLARWLMGSVPRTSSSDPEQHVPLPLGMPVFVTYLTAHPDGGKLTYSDDFYGLDAKARLVAGR